jgi:phosphatidylglycerol:prolipoprotein diacylglycerol transferase
MFASPGPVLVQIGPFSVRWYGLMTAIALVVALWLLDRQARAEGLPPEDVIGCAAWAAVTSAISERDCTSRLQLGLRGRHWDKILAV